MKTSIIKLKARSLPLALSLLFLLLASTLSAQTLNTVKQEEAEKSQAKNRVRWGVGANIFWSTIKGTSLPQNYFVKPSLGVNVRAEYYFLPFMGVGLGIGYQQRGAGAINPDKSGGAFSHPFVVDKNGNQGDPDSTYLEKIRFSTLEVPLTILLRTPMDIFKGVRLSGSAGILYIYNFESNNVFESVASGNHSIQPVTGSYLRHDVGYQVSAGMDINPVEAGNQFQIHFVYSEGLGNIFAAGQGTGTQVAYGIRLTCIF